MVRDVLLVPWFEKFIKESKNGKRRQHNGQRISIATIKNYGEILQSLKEFEIYRKEVLKIKINIKNNKKQISAEREYWKRFYDGFSDFLFKKKKCFDNYAGHNFKVIKCFFRWLKNEKYLVLHEFYERFYVRREDIRIITLLPERFCFLVMDKEFNSKLNIHMKRIRDMLVFGCVCALRFSDLTHLKVKDVERYEGHYFLYFRSCKTDTPVHIKLPQFAIDIYEKFKRRKKPSDLLFPYACMSRFNWQVKRIFRMAGWTEMIGKSRNRNGEAYEIRHKSHCIYQFCDLASSHIMRRTGITILLMLGMPEYLVRKISGHAAHSKSFYRYVNFAQSYITDEIDKAHKKLLELWEERKDYSHC